MPILLVLTVIVLGGLTWIGLRSFRELSPPTRGKLSRATLKTGVGVSAVILIALLSLRFGVHWITVVGAVFLGLVARLPIMLRAFSLLKQWRQGQTNTRSTDGDFPPGGGRRARMSRKEALAVFGLSEGAAKDDILREYRRLMKRVHPDQGGSAYLSTKLNEAKDVLLQ